MKFFLIFITIIISTCGQENPAFDLLGTYNGKKYYIPTHFIVAWVQARTICQTYGYELASFETVDELHAVKNMMNSDTTKFPMYAHVDGVRKGSEYFFGISGKKILYQLPWDAGQPNNGEEYFLCLGRDGLHDVTATNNNQKFICECL